MLSSFLLTPTIHQESYKQAFQGLQIMFGERRRGREFWGQVDGLTIILNIEMQAESSSACSGMIAPIKRCKRSSYAKISLKTKLQFFQRVLKEKANIRQVANQLGIKYSTAKTLLRNYRQIYEQTDKTLIRTLLNEHKNKEKSKVRCSYAAMPTKAYDIGCGNSPLTTSITESLIFRPRIQIISTCLAGRSQ